MADSSFVADGATSSAASGGWRWDVALSFAAAQRPYVEQVAAALKAHGVRCFYDADEETDLWGKHLPEELPAIYAERAAAVVVVFVSTDYATRDWTRWECRAALERAVRERREYILQARFDDTLLPGLLPGEVFIKLRDRTPEWCADKIFDKLAKLGIISPPTTPAAVTGAAKPVWGQVPRYNYFFTGRDRELGELRRRLVGADSRAMAAASVCVLVGMGGVGKTHLAIKYIYKHENDYGLVWWVHADTPTQVEAALDELADALRIPKSNPEQRRRQMWDALADRTSWLLVYDNVTDPDGLAEILPPPRPRLSGHVLVTSRGRPPRFPTMEVTAFRRDESIALLRRHVPELPTTEADRVAAAVDDLPLAVDQVGAYLTDTTIDVDSYLRQLADHPRRMFGKAAPDHPGLVAVVTESRTRLAEQQPAAAGLLDQLAFLASAPIPLTVSPTGEAGHITLVTDHTGPDEPAEWIRRIVRLALARRVNQGLELGSLVAALLRDRLTPADRAVVLGQTLHLLATATTGDYDNPARWPAWRAITPHLQAATHHLDTRSGTPAVTEPDSFRHQVAGCAWYLHRIGQNRAARDLAEHTRTRWLATLGADHPDSLRVANVLVAALDRLGDPQAARELAEDTVDRSQRILGPDDPHTLRSADDLAAVLVDLGDYQAARALAEETLTRWRQVRGLDDHRTLTSASNLARYLAALGEHRAARSLEEDTLTRRRRVLGADHPDTLTSANNLARHLAALEEYEAARDLAKDTLDHRRRVLGDDHPDTLATATYLAVDLATLKEHQAARNLDEETWIRRRRLLGDDHRDTLTSASNLARDLAALGKLWAARDLDRSTFDRRRRVLGDDHPDTLVSAINLRSDLRKLKLHHDAQALDDFMRQRVANRELS